MCRIRVYRNASRRHEFREEVGVSFYLLGRRNDGITLIEFQAEKYWQRNV